MANNRIVYQNWIVDMGYDPGERTAGTGSRRPPGQGISLHSPAAAALTDEDILGFAEQAARVALVREQVDAALAQLADEEREFVVRFYFMGESYRRISEKSGRAVHKLESLHKRCLRKLRKELAPFIQETYRLRPAIRRDCPICRSPHLVAINRLIRDRDKSSTWKPVLRVLREKYGLYIASPQLLIGHEKYH
ncbi:MAG: sigma-70 family RNA polymerase sigma factor [candidate division Zixibacteria bacterium]|nr:sigma-70 family RNA polymerase sigma factor [candidate division Zixibacteria bacterium]